MICVSTILFAASIIAGGATPAREITITDAVEMSGLVRVASFTVSEGAVVQAMGDLVIISDGPIRIDGKVIGWDGSELHPDAGAIRLVSMDSMTIDRADSRPWPGRCLT